ncbi:MAG: DUF6483 family protein [candidate division WOR-3 bacterium]|jgi:hypothetical protein
MITRDYLMRLIEQFTESISKILKLKKEKDCKKALEVIDKTYNELFGFNSLFINSYGTEDLISIVSTDGVPDINKCIIIATLLKEEGEIYEARNRKDISRMRYLKSLDIFLRGFLSESEIKMDADFYDLEKVVEKSGEENLSSDVKKRLYEYYEKIDKNK